MLRHSEQETYVSPQTQLSPSTALRATRTRKKRTYRGLKIAALLLAVGACGIGYTFRPRDLEAMEREAGLPTKGEDLIVPAQPGALDVTHYAPSLGHLSNKFRLDLRSLMTRLSLRQRGEWSDYHSIFRSPFTDMGEHKFELELLVSRNADLLELADMLSDAPALDLGKPNEIGNRIGVTRGLSSATHALLTRAWRNYAKGDAAKALSDVQRATRLARALDIADTLAQMDLYGFQRDVYSLLVRITNLKGLTPAQWDLIEKLGAEMPAYSFNKFYRSAAFNDFAYYAIDPKNPRSSLYGRSRGPFEVALNSALGATEIDQNDRTYKATEHADYPARMGYFRRESERHRIVPIGSMHQDAMRMMANQAWQEADAATSRKLFALAVRALREGKKPDVAGVKDSLKGEPFALSDSKQHWTLAVQKGDDLRPLGVDARAPNQTPWVEFQNGTATWGEGIQQE